MRIVREGGLFPRVSGIFVHTTSELRLPHEPVVGDFFKLDITVFSCGASLDRNRHMFASSYLLLHGRLAKF